MSEPAALLGVPDQIRALRAFVKEHAPTDGPSRCCVITADAWLMGAEVTVECLLEALTPADHPRHPPQQFHAPLADQVEPRVPRRSGSDPRLPAGRHHP